MATILAIGSGGFFEAKDAAMQRHILGCAGTPRPRVCFVPTGKGDNPQHFAWFDRAFADLPCETRHLQLFDRSVRDLRGFVLEHDVVLVWGGNTASMLAVWRAHGLDVVLREASAAGVVLAGYCAGALAWFQGGITDSFGELTALHDGLGVLPGSLCPHADGDPGRAALYAQSVRSGDLPPGFALDADVGLRFDDGVLTGAFSSRAGAGARRVEASGSSSLEVQRLEGSPD